MLPSYLLSLAALPLALAAPAKCCNKQATSRAYHETIMNNYLNVWAGDLSLVNSTFAPALTLHGDRFPTGAHGSVQLAPLVNSSAAFAAFVQSTRSGFNKYEFAVDRWAGDGLNVVIRWILHGVIGHNFHVVPTYVEYPSKVFGAALIDIIEP